MNADDPQNKPDETEESNTENHTEPAAPNGPSSAAPPRIVSEAPLGGVAKPLVTPTPPTSDADALDDVRAEQEIAAAAAQASAEEPSQDAIRQTMPADVFGEETLAERNGIPVDAPTPQTPIETLDDDEPTTPEKQIAARLNKLLGEDAAGTPTESGAGEVEAEAPAAAEGEVAPPQPAAKPATPAPSPAPAPTVSKQEWEDDDLSPELAAVLFGDKKASAPAAPEASIPRPQPESDTTAAVEVTPEPEPEPEPEPDAAPIMLTDIKTVRSLPITAEKRAAPAPETALTGKARYVRVEEPLRNDEGERVEETWSYLKPDYPGLAGRLVKEVSIEEIRYSDGSWQWRYERKYTDRGRDSREVRANPDRTYIEREDEVSKLDATTGRKLNFKEEVELIYAAPEKKDKGGLLSNLGGLLGLDDDDDEENGPKEWRVATSSETRNARKQGGEALKRNFLGL